jgi:16S rRNA (adenine1518-N6/adenine1519-N6)-dimethyltransferase
LEAENQPSLIVLLIQKEVAQRICAKPPRLRQGNGGQAKMSLLSVAAQFYAEPKIISYVSKKSFWPQPKVDSAIIKITPQITPSSSLPLASGELCRGEFRDEFFEVVKAGFAHPRKQLLNNLSTGLKISREEAEKLILKAELSPKMRPSELSVDNWRNLLWIIRGK